MPPVDVDFIFGHILGISRVENGDLVFTVSLHPITFEDVVLIFASVVPMWCLLVHVIFTAMPEWWTSLGEKAEEDEQTERARAIAVEALNGGDDDPLCSDTPSSAAGRNGTHTAYGGADADEDEDEECGAAYKQRVKQQRMSVDFDLPNGIGNNQQRSKGRVSVDVTNGKTRPSRPGGLPTPGALPAPSCYASWHAWLMNMLPPQLRPRAVAARAKSYWKSTATRSASPGEVAWSLLKLLFCNGLCCRCCASITARILPAPGRSRRSVTARSLYGKG